MRLQGLLQIMKPALPAMSLAAICSILTVAANIGLLGTSALLIATAALHPPLAALAVAITGVRFFGISRAAFRYAERYLAHTATFHILCSLRVWFFACLEPLAPARLQPYKSGDLLSRLIADIDTLQYFYLRVIGPLLAAVVILLVMCWWLSAFAPVLGMLLAAAFVLSGAAVPYCTRRAGRKISLALLAERAKLKTALVDTLEGIAELSAFGQTNHQADRLAAIGRQLSFWQSRKAAYAAWTEGLNSLLVNGTVWCALVLVVPLVAAGKIDGVYLAVLLLAIQASFEAVLPLPAAVYYLEESRAAAERLFFLTETQPAAVGSSTAEPVPERFDLTFSHLSFAYPGEAQCALCDICFSLPAGKRLAIVGASGAGKSTLVSLLLRFREYESGAIMLDRRDLRGFAPEEVRRRFAVVSQETHLFAASVGDNIRLARPEASLEEVRAAAQSAAIDDFIQTLPQGYDTLVGVNGKAISGGQRQRLSIARALLKNAPVLILDEPTAGLDAITAREVMAEVSRLMLGRTTILITHQLTGLQGMDEILVLDQGRIVERGTFRQLITKPGLFYRMWQLQQDIL
ncbi:thiol reductant ABC exporter subunit CydC [Anaerospora hongkongensis]|uniref:thiol reductant ABC exporter subunit CydC n=1 Tax=Anaerospora hongkongensis TaxID=244830 RepID=UPI00289E6FC7|nr:thiol reductant ABC exporter subunit CydC [Anaerospora hongkongensis]